MFAQMLESLQRTPGVMGAALFSDDRQCLGHTLPPPYDPVLAAEMLERFEAVGAITASLDEGDPTSLVMVTDVAQLFINQLPGVSLMVLSDVDANPSMIHVACNSIALKIRKLGAAPARAPQRSLPPPIPQSHAASHSGSFPAVHGVSTSNADWKSFLQSTASQTPPPDAIGIAFSRHVLRVLTRYLSDDAKYVFRDACAKMGVHPQTLRRSQVTEFLDLLGQAIPSRGERRRFRTDALGA